MEIKGLEDHVSHKEEAGSLLSGSLGVPSVPYGKPIGQGPYFVETTAAIPKCRKADARLYGVDNGRCCVEDAGEQ